MGMGYADMSGGEACSTLNHLLCTSIHTSTDVGCVCCDVFYDGWLSILFLVLDMLDHIRV